MIIDWLRLVPALLLLLTPIGLFHGPKVRYRLIARDWDRHWRQVLALGLHAIDFGRALLGGWLLADSLALAPGTKGLVTYGAVMADAAVLMIGMTAQTFVCKERDSTHAPYAFACGLLLGFFIARPAIGGFAVLLAAVITVGTRVPGAFFPVLGLAVGLLGFLFGGRAMLLKVVVAAVTSALPMLLSLLYQRPLVISYLAKRSSDSTAPNLEIPEKKIARPLSTAG